MAKVYVLRPAQLLSTPTFRLCPTASIERIISYTEAVVFKEGTDIYKSGQMGDCLYFIVRGRVAILRAPDAPKVPLKRSGIPLPTSSNLASLRNKELKDELEMVVSSGSYIGERGCVFLEKRRHTARTLSVVQAWRLRRSDLMNEFLGSPDWFLRTKKALNDLELRNIPPPPRVALTKCPLWPSCAADAMSKLLSPAIFEATAHLHMSGTPLSCI
eukprot:NODE_1517_length_1139_cov_78.155963_g1235_i0.p1 GENE.NODE_1517_length_1139_cov_78.155963_g1235_i0~~NODE_1517_length_1139_cov_78.155963_g1235_i0.p1  ORF type:complete len:241 (-),score=73.91 NODE_1517_length_1139_cov_78.155963_g1235_i0:415-1059(-)